MHKNNHDSSGSVSHSQPAIEGGFASHPMKIRVLPLFPLCVLACAVFMSGCASIYRVALTSETSAKLNSSTISGVVAVEKEEIGTVFTPSGMAVAMNGGLVFEALDAVINGIKSKKAEKKVVEIHDGLLGYEFDQALVSALSRRFSQAGDGNPALTAVTVSKSTTMSEISRLIQEADNDAVMIVFTRHLMSLNFKSMVVVADAMVCAKSDALRASATPVFYGEQEFPVLYRNRIQSFWVLPALTNLEDGAAPPPEAVESPQKAWARDGAASLRSALNADADEIAEVIQWDLREPDRENYKRKAPGGSVSMLTKDYGGSAPMEVECKIYRRANNRMWLRSARGCVYAHME